MTKLFNDFLSLTPAQQEALVAIFAMNIKRASRTPGILTHWIQTWEHGITEILSNKGKVWVEAVRNDDFANFLNRQIQPNKVLSKRVKEIYDKLKIKSFSEHESF